ncbi:MAG: hypothetical protein AAFY26_24045, partial [Cyanobacteria bacterium J06638_22]
MGVVVVRVEPEYRTKIKGFSWGVIFLSGTEGLNTPLYRKTGFCKGDRPCKTRLQYFKNDGGLWLLIDDKKMKV